jgi:hypothetical protein
VGYVQRKPRSRIFQNTASARKSSRQDWADHASGGRPRHSTHTQRAIRETSERCGELVQPDRIDQMHQKEKH